MRGMRFGVREKQSWRFESRNLGSAPVVPIRPFLHCFLFHFLLRIPCTLLKFSSPFSFSVIPKNKLLFREMLCTMKPG